MAVDGAAGRETGGHEYGGSWALVRQMWDKKQVRGWTYTPILGGKLPRVGGCMFAPHTMISQAGSCCHCDAAAADPRIKCAWRPSCRLPVCIGTSCTARQSQGADDSICSCCSRRQSTTLLAAPSLFQIAPPGAEEAGQCRWGRVVLLTAIESPNRCSSCW